MEEYYYDNFSSQLKHIVKKKKPRKLKMCKYLKKKTLGHRCHPNVLEKPSK